MHIFLFNNISKSISGFLVTILIATSCILAPISHETGQVQKVSAHGPVTVVGGTGTVQQTLTAAASKASLVLQNSLFIKEWTLDGIASGLAKLMLKSMTQSILTWINSGFQGSPAFVTDLEQFLKDRVDQTVGEFIYNDSNLNFLCSPFQLDVKIALATTYRQEAHEGLDVQCTLSGVTDNVEGFLNGSFSEGGWESWFEVTQNTVNTPTGAYLEAEAEMYARIVDDQGNTIRELDWGEGFLSFKVCSDTDAATGAETGCDITTPGKVIADQLTVSLESGQQALIEADEINEIIGALFAQLAQQAITGVNGLLGLGGSSYSSNYNSSGTYLDALGEESTVSDDLENPFSIALAQLTENVALQNDIVSAINASEARLLTAQARHPLKRDPDTNRMVSSCSAILALELPSELEDIRLNAALDIILAELAETTLTNLSAQFASSSDPRELTTILEAYNELEATGQIITPLDNILLQIYIDIDLEELIAAFNRQIISTENQCSNNGGGP